MHYSKKTGVLLAAAGLLFGASMAFILIKTASATGNLQTQRSNDTSEVTSIGQPGLSFRYLRTFGVSEQAYFSDSVHLNRPKGLFMDAGNHLYVTEDYGYRVLKYDAAGNNQLALGKAGMCITDDYLFCTPEDIALDGGGNLWVADGNRLVEYDTNGTFVQQLPTTEPWAPGNDNTHFDFVNGIGFDGAGHMYASDTNNHRVQVYTFIAGAPVYSATIGVTGESGGDNTHFNNPLDLVVDSIDRVYVVDQGNNRVQQCTYSGGWACGTFDSGLNNPQGIALDGSDNVYIADTNNGRIRKCSSAGVCADFVNGTYGLYDLAVDSNGNVYGAATYEGIVVRYNSSGGPMGTFLGVEFVPYLTDNYHYFRPRVAIDGQDNIIIVEELGQRLTKLSPDGAFIWSVGVPGVDAQDNAHFIYPHGVAADQAGNIYVANNTQVQIFDGNGVYSSTLGTGSGSGDYQFAWVTGISVDKNGYIYVSDGSNQRVQIYNQKREYVATLGVTGVLGSDNAHFNYPIGVEVDKDGNIYVADIGNCRVQKFNSNRAYQMTFGTTGSCTNSFADVSAEDVTVDAQGRVYISGWDDRVQIFDSTGAYLTTIGGAWGANSSQFRGASGVAVDSAGNVYVADFNNSRIQKFARGVPGWRQTNINGFGNPNTNRLPSLAVFKGYLYAGTGNFNQNIFHVWRSADGTNWEQAGSKDLGGGVAQLSVFNDTLYAGTWGANVWSSPDGLAWTRVISGGFGGDSTNAIARFSVFDNRLYATTWNDATGTQIWRTSNGTNWDQFGPSGLGDPDNGGAMSSEVFGGQLYWGVGNWNGPDGAQLWRTDGITVTAVMTDGFGDPDNKAIWTLAAYNGDLYAGTSNENGVQVWRSSDGSQWNQVAGGGLGNSLTNDKPALKVFNDQLFLIAQNSVTGLEVWRTSNGATWKQVGFGGFGDSNNELVDYDSSVTPFNGNLYIAAYNPANGGEIWQLLDQLYLPLVRR
jgi:uncharacterized protein YjiK